MAHNTKFHFSHPNHPLLHHSDHREYICGACKTSGFGSRFRCQYSCNFNIHEYCADCPQKLPPSIHHHHLTLFLRKPKPDRLNELICDVCRDPIDGLFYRCEYCNDFNAHPVCTQLPRELQHVADNHSLKLIKPPSGRCVVCKKDCSSLWVYGCEICRVNIHFDCVFQPYDSPATRWREILVPPPGLERSGTTTRGIPPQFPGAGYPWNVGYCGSRGEFAYLFPYANLCVGGHPGVHGYAAPYSVPDYHFVDPNFGLAYHHQASQGVNTEAPSSSSGGKLGKSMFALVGRLTLCVMSSFLFGFPITF